MTTTHDLLTTIKQVRDATVIQLRAETNADIRIGMEINLDLLNRALNDAGWETGDEQFITTGTSTSEVKSLAESIAFDPYALTPDQWASEARQAIDLDERNP